MNEIDSKLVKGIFLKSCEPKRNKKDIYGTFNTMRSNENRRKSAILRKLKSFVVREPETPNSDSSEETPKFRSKDAQQTNYQ